MKNQVNFLLEKLYTIDQELGGKAKQKKTKKRKNEFDAIRADIQEKIHQTTNKQNERDQKQEKFGNKDKDVIRLNMEIRENMGIIDKDLDLLNKKLNKLSKQRQKYSEEVLQIKDQIYQNLLSQYNDLQERESSGFYDPKNPPIQTLTEAKANLWGKQQQNGQQQEQRIEAEGVELEAIKRFDEKDKKMDEALDRIIDGTHAWKHKAKLMGQKIDEAQMLEKKLNKEVAKTTKTATSQNARLKQILKHYRKPNKFCMDMTLLCLFLGLIAVMYNMFKNGSN